MYQHSRLNTNRFSFIQKFKNFDYILLACILMLGFISLATMYSTDGGKVLFHTKSHFTKLIVFTLMMLIISFINLRWILLVIKNIVRILIFEAKLKRTVKIFNKMIQRVTYMRLKSLTVHHLSLIYIFKNNLL